jgi:hypothetical protein
MFRSYCGELARCRVDEAATSKPREDAVLWRLLSEGHADSSWKILLANKALLISWHDQYFRIKQIRLVAESWHPEKDARFYQALRLQVRGD